MCFCLWNLRRNHNGKVYLYNYGSCGYPCSSCGTFGQDRRWLQVDLQGNGKTGDLKRIFTVMGLGIKAGMTITVTVEGEDEKEAASTLKSFLKENL